MLILNYFNMYRIISFTLLALGIGSALAAESPDVLRCGNVEPPNELLELAKAMVREGATAADRTLVIDTFFHVVEARMNEGTTTYEMLMDQVRLKAVGTTSRSLTLCLLA